MLKLQPHASVLLISGKFKDGDFPPADNRMRFLRAVFSRRN